MAVIDDVDDRYKCEFCDKSFTTKASMVRHIKKNCKKAKHNEINNSGNAEKLLLVSGDVSQINALNTTNNNTTNNNTTNHITYILPWSAPNVLIVTIQMVRAVMDESRDLQEYKRFTPAVQNDQKVAMPYMIRLFADLLKKAHTEPLGRNIYPNPARTDQVRTFNHHWDNYLQSDDSIRIMFDDIETNVNRTVDSYGTGLSADILQAVKTMMDLYSKGRNNLLRCARPVIMAHLKNNEVNIGTIHLATNAQLTSEEPPVVNIRPWVRSEVLFISAINLAAEFVHNRNLSMYTFNTNIMALYTGLTQIMPIIIALGHTTSDDINVYLEDDHAKVYTGQQGWQAIGFEEVAVEICRSFIQNLQRIMQTPSKRVLLDSYAQDMLTNIINVYLSDSVKFKTTMFCTIMNYTNELYPK